ncbi:efflux RND transporter permease subunit [Roseomonas sp. USHLN139]|uniref:efflux RND transporter permease subunit n=1 Tax=Roseomonas sp. USHLN139 TaxID=3081298 RepID=UPI003B023638
MKSVSDLFIRRPVFTIVVNLVIALIGLLGLSRLPIRELPRFDLPYVSIATVYAGATPDLVERTITAPIEQAVAAIGGIDTVVSTSREGLSEIQIGFKIGTNPLDAVTQVRDKVGTLRAILPREALSPTVAQLSLDAVPVIYLSLADPRRSATEITEVVGRVVRPALASVDGVAAVQVLGERRYAVRVWLDPYLLAAHGVTASEVNDAILAQNLAVPSGTLEQDGRRSLVYADTSLVRPEQFEEVVVRRGDADALVRLRDVARVEVGPESENNSIWIDGRTALAVGVLPQSSANPLEVARATEALLPALRRLVPAGMEVNVVFDSSQTIRIAVAEVAETILVAVVLVTLVILLFLGSLRSSFIVLVTIPLSLIGMLGFMYVMGYSINTFTLLAMVLSIGLVVDDAIVDVENVQRHIDEGRDAVSAAFIGSREIGFAIVATTLTLAAVYLPIGLVPGMLGSLFREFAFTLAAGVILSGFVSRTLSPMMCSRLLRAKRPGGWAQRLDRGFAHASGLYGRLLRRLIRWRLLVVLLAFGGFVLGIGAMTKLPGEFAPADDAGYLLVKYTAPQDATNDYMARLAARVQAVFETVPERRGSMIMNGLTAPNEAIALLLLRPWAEREATAQAIGARILPALTQIAGGRFNILDPNPLAGGSVPPVQVVVKSTGSYEDLSRAMAPLAAYARAHPGLVAPTVDLDLNTRRIDVAMDRPLAASLGIDIARIGQSINVFLGGQQAGFLGYGGEQYKVMLQVEEALRRDADILGNIYVRAADNSLVPLAQVARPRETVGASALPRFQQLRSARISASIAPGASLGPVLADLEAEAARVLPPGTQLDFDGPSRALKQADATVLLVMLLALVFIYLVLSAQFESFRDPVIVLSVVPVAIVGAGLGLIAVGGSLNAYSFIGLVTLVGLVAKNGILITEFANQLRDEGRSIEEAVVEAAATRLRPILMTTVATMLGAVPLLLTVGPGARSREDLGAVMVGGMGLGLVVSLLLVPACYLLLSKRERHRLVETPETAVEGAG